MTHDGRMSRGKYNSDNNINLNNNDTLYYLANKDAPKGLQELVGVSEKEEVKKVIKPKEKKKNAKSTK